MLSKYLIAPSFTILLISGLLILFFIIVLFLNLNEIKKFNTFQKLSILGVLIVGVSSHGLIHLGLEEKYNFNPYNWF